MGRVGSRLRTPSEQSKKPAEFSAGFFDGDAVHVARALIGAELVAGDVVVRITETEAYRHDDSACHAFKGRTARTNVLFGPSGRWYVYLCYGIHRLMNVVTGPDGQAGAVLFRAAEPVAGIETIRLRRGDRRGPSLLDGPGKLGAALGATLEDTGHGAVGPSERPFLRPGSTPTALLAGARIGIDYAAPKDRDAPWRFAAANTRWVGHRKGLRPLTG